MKKHIEDAVSKRVAVSRQVSCPDPRWEPSEQQIAEALNDRYMLDSNYGTVKLIGLRRIPIKYLQHDLIPFRTHEYAAHYMDPKGGLR